MRKTGLWHVDISWWHRKDSILSVSDEITRTKYSNNNKSRRTSFLDQNKLPISNSTERVAHTIQLGIDLGVLNGGRNYLQPHHLLRRRGHQQPNGARSTAHV